MNNLFQNKKVLIAAGISVGVIILAIIIFIIIGVKDKKNQQHAKVMEFNTVQTSEPTGSEEPKNESKNEVVEERKSNEEVLEDMDEKYSKPILSFIDALLEEDDMESFIEDYFASKAYLAMQEDDYEDSKLMEIYETIDDDDAKDIEDKLMEIPEKLAEVKKTKEGLSELSNTLDNTTSEGKNEEIGIYITDVSDVEEYNEDDKDFVRAYLTLDILTVEKDLVITFYGEAIINITDDEGNSIFDIIDEIE